MTGVWDVSVIWYLSNCKLYTDVQIKKALFADECVDKD